MSTITQPQTILEVMNLVAKLHSRKAGYKMLIAHLQTCYKDNDSGKAELRMMREDLAIVPQEHVEAFIGELMDNVERIDVELETLQNQPVGGGAPPAAVQPLPAQTVPKAAENAAIATVAPGGAVVAPVKTKGTPSGKPRAQGGGAS